MLDFSGKASRQRIHYFKNRFRAECLNTHSRVRMHRNILRIGMYPTKGAHNLWPPYPRISQITNSARVRPLEEHGIFPTSCRIGAQLEILGLPGRSDVEALVLPSDRLGSAVVPSPIPC
jgi:hypothetical protein